MKPRISPRALDDCARLARAFTITEIMVVVAVVTVLMGLLLPAVRSVRTHGRQTLELNAARQLMTAYVAYANNNRNLVMPGYAPSTFKVYDAQGAPITGGTELMIARRRYPWRLASYLDFEIRGFFSNEHREVLERLRHEDHNQYVYAVSQSPSLGINGQWVGGHYAPSHYTALPGTQEYAAYINLFGKFYITSMTEARHPERLIVFASARGEAPLTESGVVQGFYRVESPYFSYIDPSSRWSHSFQQNGDPADFGFVSPRYFGRAVIGFMDGRADTLTTEQLKDMRHWANRADSPEWVIPPNSN